MATTMIVGALIACVYAALIALHAAAIRHGGTARKRLHPATWLAANGERRRGREESGMVRRRIAGELDRRGYHDAMAALAARDAIEHPLEVPKSLR
ncbi:hypothetical protein ABT369_46420 [Dactylosporangium sp. NPDC000244]|uniref:hypothetical protein n=1 Tax=Dactylosporangium sp. NPDC000244 TaxID=3154365 RepID=UPI00331BCA19